MKILGLGFLVLFLTGIACAQPAQTETSPGSSVSVIEISWRKEVFIPALYDDPMRINQDRDDLERDRKATAAENATRAKQGQAPIPTPGKKIASNIPVGSTPMGVPLGDEPAGNRNLPAQKDPDAASVYYLYKAKVKNGGAKDIRTIRWQYLLSDHETGETVGTHVFTTPVNLRAGKTVDLIGKSRSLPARVISAKTTDKDLRGKYVERVVIDAIEYMDGQVWPATP